MSPERLEEGRPTPDVKSTVPWGQSPGLNENENTRWEYSADGRMPASPVKAQALSTELHKLVMLVDAYNPRAQEVEPGRSGVQSYPWLQKAFKVSLGYMRP